MRGSGCGPTLGAMRRYLALARLPNGLRLLAGSLLVAPGQAAIDLVILLALDHATGSFGAGGVAVAVGTIAFSASTIVQGRLIDRFGIRRVLGPAALALATATTTLAAAVALGSAPALLIGLSAVLGLSQPTTGAAARTVMVLAPAVAPSARDAIDPSAPVRPEAPRARPRNMTSTANPTPAGSALSTRSRGSANTPIASPAPASTSTTTFVALVNRNRTAERSAITRSGIPARESSQPPAAIPPAPPTGTTAPNACSAVATALQSGPGPP
jgi:hypothetical protein